MDAFIASQEAAAQRTQAAQAAIAEAAENGSEASSRAINSLVQQVARMSESYGLNNRQLIEQKAAVLGVSDSIAPYIDKMNAVDAATRRAAEAQREFNAEQARLASNQAFLASLQTRADTVGMSGADLLAYQAQQRGQAADAAPIIAQIREKEAALKQLAEAQLMVNAAEAGESEAEATARISAMVAASLEATAAISSTTDAADRYASSVDAMAAAATAAERANTGIATSARAAATAQAAVTAEFKAASTVIGTEAEKVAEALGRQLTALTATQAQMVEYDAQMAGFTEAETAQVAAIAKEIELRKQQIALGEEMAAAYAVETTAAHGAAGATAGVTAEIGVLGREAASGNFTRLASSFTRFLSLAGALDLLLNPLSITIAGVGAAMYMVASQNEKMNEALALTGGYAGVTADQLRNMATAATAGGATFNTAVEAVTELAATGRLTGEEIENLGKTAADAATYTSMSVKQMVDQFTKLAEEPVQASVKLNDQYHYLTAATYDQIAALERQGDATGAAKVAVEAFSQAMDDRTKEIAANEGIILAGWRDIKAMINGAIEAVGSFGAAATPGQVVARLQDNKSARLPIGQWSPEDEAELQKAISTRDAAVKAAQDKARTERQNQQTIDAKHAYDTFNSQFATPAEKRAKEIQKYLDTIAGPLGLSPEQQLADEANIDAKYKDPKTPKPKAVRDDAGARMLQQLRDQQAALDAQLSTTGKLTTAESELAKFNQQVSDWKNKTLTPQQASLIADQDAIRAQLQKNVELEKEIQHREDVQKLQERSAQIDASMASYQKGQNDQYGRQLGAFGMGSEAQKNAQAVKSVYAEYQRLQEQLDKATPKDLIGGADYVKASADIKAGLDQSLQDYDAYYASLKAKQADWTNGASAAIANYMDSAQNMAAQTESAVTNVAKSMEDAFVSLATTGKFNFKSLADSVIADIIRMQARAAISGLFNMAISAAGSYFGNTGATFAANAQGGDALDNLVSSSGGWGTIPARASGGPVDAGTTYLVGEKGPELFNPGASGTITPNHAITSSSSGDINVTVPVSVQGGGSADDQRNAGDLGMKIKQAVQAVLQNERKQGGVLWKTQNGIA
ncbi:phage tail tape measure protein [Paraburkholderia sp. BL21I4N1]|uniref:phage tail tape measure protein n=1 Tax=Paraburkholderia sp. BL21I4N1 TaxID=1938801 RepID=UPI0011B229FB|nr:phage tail tape measure protein [Paraburkholderia sp. BL21I4N1]